jgi:hypothetical protein
MTWTNQAASGKGGSPVVFGAESPRPALPEQNRWAH